MHTVVFMYLGRHKSYHIFDKFFFNDERKQFTKVYVYLAFENIFKKESYT